MVQIKTEGMENHHCSVCIRECEIGQSFCHRRDTKGNIIQPNKFNAVVIDTLADKPITHFGENAEILSVGSWGCNLRCLGCQNVTLSWAIKGCCLGYKELSADQLTKMALENGCKGICFTYNEPAILLETIEEYSYKARENGLFTVFVTNSTLTEKSTKRLSKCIDVVAADIKSMDDKFYYQYCGAEGIDAVARKILTCIKTFADSGVHVEVRTNIIPGGNDQDENYLQIASWIKNNMGIETPWHITRFFPAHQLSHIQPTSLVELEKAKSAGLRTGLKYVHTYSEKGCDCAQKDHLFGNDDAKNDNKESSCCKKEMNRQVDFNNLNFSMNKN